MPAEPDRPSAEAVHDNRLKLTHRESSQIKTEDIGMAQDLNKATPVSAALLFLY